MATQLQLINIIIIIYLFIYLKKEQILVRFIYPFIYSCLLHVYAKIDSGI